MSVIPDEALPAAAASAPQRRAAWGQVFLMLLRREYWEHRLAFLWAPATLGLITLVMATIGTIVATAMAHKAANQGELQLHLDGNQVVLDRLDLGAIAGSLDPLELRQMAQALDMTFVLVSTLPFLVVPFVVFFYCLGALFDDRKDRSILFWKSLPISDRDTVLSKLVSAVLVIPAIASLVAIATLFGFMALLSLVSVLYGGNPVTLIWQPTHWLWLSTYYLAYPLIYLQSAIPTVGWLLLCSAWTRRGRPFLWAVMLPLLASILITVTLSITRLEVDLWWHWKNILPPLLLGVFGLNSTNMRAVAERLQSGDGDISTVFRFSDLYISLTGPAQWIALVAGALMIVAAVYLRRQRDDS